MSLPCARRLLAASLLLLTQPAHSVRSCKGRCTCSTARAEAALLQMDQMASKVSASVQSGTIERGELDDTSSAASNALDAIQAMRDVCAASCTRGCRGCRVHRLLNQTRALQEGVDETTAMGYFVDDERTLEVLPNQLSKQASAARAVAADLHNLASHCPRVQQRLQQRRESSAAGAATTVESKG